MIRTLRAGHDVLELVPAFGLLLRDSYDARVVSDGLRVELRDTLSGRMQRLAANGYGVFVAHGVRGLRGAGEGSPAPRRRCDVRLSDDRQRFLPLRLEAELPGTGLFDPDDGAASPPQREPHVRLYSAPTRQLPAGSGSLRAELRRASDPAAPASWARVELWLQSVLLGEGVADREGRLLLPCRLPPPRDPPLHGSPPAPASGFERNRWEVTLRAWWDPAMAAAAVPELGALRAQPEVALLRDAASPDVPLGPQVLRAGSPLVVRSDGSSYLFVGA